MNLKASLLKVLCLSLSLPLFSKTTVIKGVSSEFKLQRIVYYLTEEYVTEKQKKIGEGVINSDGKFEISFNSSSISSIAIKIQNQIARIYTEPGKVYNVNIKKSTEENKNRIYDRRLTVSSLYPNPDDINFQISKVNTRVDAFIESNENYFNVRNEEVFKLVSDFRNSLAKEYANHPSDFIKDYVKYSVGNIELGLDAFSRGSKKSRNIKPQLFRSYFFKQNILFTNAQYFRLFKDFFKEDFKQLTLTKKGYGITKAINDFGSLKKLKEALKPYHFFKEPTIMEIFILNGFLEIRNDKFFNFKNKVKILNQLKEKGANSQIKIVAENILEMYLYKRLSANSIAPEFNIQDVNGKYFKLENFKQKGKYIYINFFAHWSIPSLTEMKLLERIYQKYKNKVTFISICTDRDKNKLKEFLKRNKNYTWNFLWNPPNTNLLDDFEVRTIPTYALLDDKLKLVSYPAPRPSGGFERGTEVNISTLLYQLTNKKK